MSSNFRANFWIATLGIWLAYAGCWFALAWLAAKVPMLAFIALIGFVFIGAFLQFSDPAAFIEAIAIVLAIIAILPLVFGAIFKERVFVSMFGALLITYAGIGLSLYQSLAGLERAWPH